MNAVVAESNALKGEAVESAQRQQALRQEVAALKVFTFCCKYVHVCIYLEKARLFHLPYTHRMRSRHH